jgi:hypothetical protein
MNRHLVPLGCLVLVAGLGFTPPAAALQEEVSRPELCTVSDAVAIAEVTSEEVAWTEDADGGIVRRVWFALSLSLRGDAPETLEVLLPGGEIDGVRYKVEDSPEQLRLDRRYLLFLDRNKDGSYSVVGGEAGAVLVAQPGDGDGERFIDAVASVGVCDAQ